MFSRINESFNKIYKPIVESVTDKEQLRMNLERVAKGMEIAGNNNLKTYEMLFQDEIENFYPGKLWWEVTDCNIFMDLFNNRDPHGTIDRIIDGIKDDTNEAFDKGDGSGPYWYFTRHGVQPGSVPKDITVLEVKDADNGSYFLSDKVLTTQELKDYEITEKRPVDEDVEDLPHQGNKVLQNKNQYGYATIGMTIDDKNKKYQMMNGMQMPMGKYSKSSKSNMYKTARDLKDKGYTRVRNPKNDIAFEESVNGKRLKVNGKYFYRTKDGVNGVSDKESDASRLNDQQYDYYKKAFKHRGYDVELIDEDTTVKTYSDGKSKHTIVKDDNGKYFNHYSVDDNGNASSIAGKFDDEKTARQMMKKHRPQSVEMNESPTYDMSPVHDNRKSFYGKARVDDNNGEKTLYSYNTPVAKISNGEVTLLDKWDSSQTTLRHVKEFLKQNGFEASSLAQMKKSYK